MSFMFKFSWEILLFQRGDTEAFKAARNKLFACNEKQIDNHTLVLDMLYSYMSVVLPTIEEVTLKLFFWCGCCSLLIFVAKTVIKGTQLQCLCTHKVPSQVEE